MEHCKQYTMITEGDWLATYGTENKYQYNGKELNTDLELNLSDFGARWYDAAIGRWTSVDPLASKNAGMSPYTYVVNNPVIFVDPNGMDTVSIVGNNGNSLQFIHDDFEKQSFNVPFGFESSNSINFNERGNGTAPDVIGYSVGISASGNALFAGGKADAFKNYAIFTSGSFDWQPFEYFAGGVQGGVASLTDFFAGDVSLSVSGFAAWAKDISLAPSSWAGGFIDGTANASFGEGIVGGGSIGYFQSTSMAVNGTGYIGFSVGLSLGKGVKAGAPASWSILGGGSYYHLMESHPTKTNVLLSSKIGMARLASKWAGFGSMGQIPGTAISDWLH